MMSRRNDGMWEGLFVAVVFVAVGCSPRDTSPRVAAARECSRVEILRSVVGGRSPMIPEPPGGAGYPGDGVLGYFGTTELGVVSLGAAPYCRPLTTQSLRSDDPNVHAQLSITRPGSACEASLPVETLQPWLCPAPVERDLSQAQEVASPVALRCGETVVVAEAQRLLTFGARGHIATHETGRRRWAVADGWLYVLRDRGSRLARVRIGEGQQYEDVLNIRRDIGQEDPDGSGAYGVRASGSIVAIFFHDEVLLVEILC